MIGSNRIPLVPEFLNLISLLPFQRMKGNPGIWFGSTRIPRTPSPLFSSNRHCVVVDKWLYMAPGLACKTCDKQVGAGGLHPTADIAGPGGYPPSTAM
jgi:hypothetical protein